MAMLVEPPGRFSTMNCCPRRSDSQSHMLAPEMPPLSNRTRWRSHQNRQSPRERELGWSLCCRPILAMVTCFRACTAAAKEVVAADRLNVRI